MHVPNMKLWTNTDSSLLMAQFQETRCFPDWNKMQLKPLFFTSSFCQIQHDPENMQLTFKSLTFEDRTLKIYKSSMFIYMCAFLSLQYDWGIFHTIRS